eukprot:7596306-Pyramimonas_sp.AAC.1
MSTIALELASVWRTIHIIVEQSMASSPRLPPPLPLPRLPPAPPAAATVRAAWDSGPPAASEPWHLRSR